MPCGPASASTRCMSTSRGSGFTANCVNGCSSRYTAADEAAMNAPGLSETPRKMTLFAPAVEPTDETFGRKRTTSSRFTRPWRFMSAPVSAWMLAGTLCMLSSRLRAETMISSMPLNSFFGVLRLRISGVTAHRHRHGNSKGAFGRNSVQIRVLVCSHWVLPVTSAWCDVGRLGSKPARLLCRFFATNAAWKAAHKPVFDKIKLSESTIIVCYRTTIVATPISAIFRASQAIDPGSTHGY